MNTSSPAHANGRYPHTLAIVAQWQVTKNQRSEPAAVFRLGWGKVGWGPLPSPSRQSTHKNTHTRQRIDNPAVFSILCGWAEMYSGIN